MSMEPDRLDAAKHLAFQRDHLFASYDEQRPAAKAPAAVRPQSFTYAQGEDALRLLGFKMIGGKLSKLES